MLMDVDGSFGILSVYGSDARGSLSAPLMRGLDGWVPFSILTLIRSLEIRLIISIACVQFRVCKCSGV